MSKGLKVGIIIVTIIILVSTISVFGYLYLFTNNFKSPNELFFQNFSNFVNLVENQFEDEKYERYEQLLENNSYSQMIEIVPELTQEVGTTNQNKNNELNEIRINATGKVNRKENYLNYDIEVKKFDETIEDINLVQTKKADDVIYGVKFNCLDQYVGFENRNIGQIAKEIGLGNNLYDSIDIANQSKNLKIDSNNIEQLNATYSNILKEYLSKASFTKSKEKLITVNSQPYQTNNYVASISYENYNRMIIAILKQIKQDPILIENLQKYEQILSLFGINSSDFVIDIDNLMEIKYNPQISSDQNINQILTTLIDDQITKIENSNTSSEKVILSLYEIKNDPIRFEIILPNSKYVFDRIKNESSNMFEFKYQNLNTVKVNSIEFRKEEKEKGPILQVTRTKDGNSQVLTHIIERSINEGNLEALNRFIYTVNKNEFLLSIYDHRKVITQYDMQELNELNYICLNTLSDSDLEDFKNDNHDNFINYQNEFNEKINIENLIDICKKLKVIDEQIVIDPYKKLTQTEVNKFNMNFEIYKSENVSKDIVLQLIDAIEQNLTGFEVSDSSTLKFTITPNEKNEILANKAREIINDENNRYYNYDISFGYNNQTSIIEYVYVKINNKKN